MGRTLVLSVLAGASFAVTAVVLYVAGAPLSVAAAMSGGLAGAGLLAYAAVKAATGRHGEGPPASAS